MSTPLNLATPVEVQPCKTGPLVMRATQRGSLSARFFDGRLAIRLKASQIDVELVFDTEADEMAFAKQMWSLARAKRARKKQAKGGAE